MYDAETRIAIMTKLERISQLSRENPDIKFTSLAHLIDIDMLKDCYEKMDGSKAEGIDKVTKADYGANLDANLQELVERLKAKRYKPKPARMVEIPKDNGKTRPISIYCFEDKLVQEALKRVLEAVYEPIFYEEMKGFRPHRNCHQAICLLGHMIEKEYTNYVLDADIEGYFSNISQEMVLRLLRGRIVDKSIIWLVDTMLKAGVVKDYVYEPTETGCGQGAVCSPIIANIVMHYMLIWWFKEVLKPYFRGFAGLVVYADDFVMCFQHKDEAEETLRRLRIRMGHFGLKLQEDKTRLIEFGMYAEENAKKRGTKPATFTFLGFTHYVSKDRTGKRFRVKRKTARQKLAKKCREMNKAIRARRGWEVGDIISWINQVLVGYFHYYGITDNYASINNFRYEVIKMLFKWLNRRSQRMSMTWKRFNQLLKVFPIEKPKIYVNVYKYAW